MEEHHQPDLTPEMHQECQSCIREHHASYSLQLTRTLPLVRISSHCILCCPKFMTRTYHTPHKCSCSAFDHKVWEEWWRWWEKKQDLLKTMTFIEQTMLRKCSKISSKAIKTSQLHNKIQEGNNVWNIFLQVPSVIIFSMLDDSCKLHIVKHAFRINWCSMQHVINFLIWKSVVRKKKFTCLVSKHMLPLGFLDWHHFSVIVMYSLMLQGIRASMVINTKRTKISRLKQRLNCSCHCVSRHHFIFLFTYSLSYLCHEITFGLWITLTTMLGNDFNPYIEHLQK